jgi:3-hydroxybutyryl-CoA dehydrogenase
VDGGRLGRKTGRGVFTYGEDGRATDAEPQTEPDRSAPRRVTLHYFSDDRPFPVMQSFVDRAKAGGVRISPQPIRDDDDETLPGIELPSGAWLVESDGTPSDGLPLPWQAPVVHLDWAHDPATCTRVALSPSPDVDATALAEAVGFCQAAGVAVSVVGASAGGVVARTVAMLVNEAVDLVARREAAPDDVDTAMKLGTGYPSGPIEWHRRLPLGVGEVLAELHVRCPTGRYRLSPGFLHLTALGMGR